MENHPEPLLEAVAEALDIPVLQVNLDNVVETHDGVLVEVSLPEDVEIPKDLATKVTVGLQDDPVFAKMEALEPGI